MLVALLLVAVVPLASGYAQLNYPVLCSRLKPVANLQLTELEGAWVTVESLLLRDGYPEPPAKSHRRTCVRTIVSDASESGMSMVSEVHTGTAKRRTGRTKFMLNDLDEPGRWNMLTRRPSSLVSEMLAIAARPSEFLVLAFCQPRTEDNDEEGSTSRPALWVKILARPSGGRAGGVQVSKREMTQLRERIAEMLGLRELASVHFDTNC